MATRRGSLFSEVLERAMREGRQYSPQIGRIQFITPPKAIEQIRVVSNVLMAKEELLNACDQWLHEYINCFLTFQNALVQDWNAGDERHVLLKFIRANENVEISCHLMRGDDMIQEGVFLAIPAQHKVIVQYMMARILNYYISYHSAFTKAHVTQFIGKWFPSYESHIDMEDLMHNPDYYLTATTMIDQINSGYQKGNTILDLVDEVKKEEITDASFIQRLEESHKQFVLLQTFVLPKEKRR